MKSNKWKDVQIIVIAALKAASFPILFAIVFEEWSILESDWAKYFVASVLLFVFVLIGITVIIKLSPFLEKISKGKSDNTKDD